MWMYAAAALVALAIGFGSGWTTRGWKADHDDAERLAAEAASEVLRAARVDTAATGDQARTAAIRVQTRVVTQFVDKIVDRPVYRTDCFDADGLRAVAAAAAGAAASAGQPAPAMPAAFTAD